MSAITESINRFAGTMADSQSDFEQVKLEIDTKDSAVKTCIDNFRRNIADVMAAGIETDDEDLQKLYDHIRGNIGALLDAVAGNIAKTEKGAKFIKDYEQSFNVAVFGKVKAGKSYLGNFIMGNRVRELDPDSAYHKLPVPTVEVYDRGTVSTRDRLEEIEQNADGFVVDPNEATSCIQLFRLGALTWFDTPGIGSVTEANELLAKDYVDNADLVIYTSNSDAAGTRQDFAEMKALYEKGKQFLLLLTQSDTLEEDWDDELGECVNTLTAKSDKDRQDTELYMRQTLRDQGLPQLRQDEVLTISAKLAMTALQDGDEARFRDSNMGQFLDVLTNITKTDGARLKRETPAKRLNAMIVDFLKSLEDAEKQLQQNQDELRRKQKDLSMHSDLVQEQIKAQCRIRIDALIRRKAMEIEKSGSTVTADELGELLSREVQSVLMQTCAGEFAASGENLSHYADALRMDEVGDLEMRRDSITYPVTKVRKVSRDPKGVFEHIGAFFGKEYYRTTTETEEKTNYFDIGVNEQQIMSVAHGQLDVLFDRDVPSIIKKISEGYLDEITKLLDASKQCIRTTREEMGRLQCKP